MLASELRRSNPMSPSGRAGVAGGSDDLRYDEADRVERERRAAGVPGPRSDVRDPRPLRRGTTRVDRHGDRPNPGTSRADDAPDPDGAQAARLREPARGDEALPPRRRSTPSRGPRPCLGGPPLAVAAGVEAALPGDGRDRAPDGRRAGRLPWRLPRTRRDDAAAAALRAAGAEGPAP